jgi:hypothetical protein
MQREQRALQGQQRQQQASPVQPRVSNKGGLLCSVVVCIWGGGCWLVCGCLEGCIGMHSAGIPIVQCAGSEKQTCLLLPKCIHTCFAYPGSFRICS